MSTHAKIAAKLVAAGQSIGHIAKGGRNDFHKYDYVTDADVLDKVRDALYAQGVAVLVNVVTVEHHFGEDKNVFTTVRGDVTFTDSESGEQMVAGFAGTGSDKGDKGYYKAVTGGVKYQLLKTLLIPTGDDPEATDESGKSTRQQPVQQHTNGTGPKPPAAEKVQTPVRTSPRGTPLPGLTDAQKKKLVIAAKERGLTESVQRHNFYLLATGKNDPNQLTPADLDKALAELADLDSEIVKSALATTEVKAA
jgi:hypothetical protein